MTDRTDGNPPGDSALPEGADGSDTSTQDLHPAIDPRELGDDETHIAPREAPPLDIDERTHHAETSHTPEVIELADHTGFVPLDVPSASEADDQALETPGGEEMSAPDPGGDAAATSVSGDDQEQPAIDPELDATRPTDENDAPGTMAKATALLSGTASKLKLGKLLETGEESPSGATPPSEKVPSSQAAGSRMAGFSQRVGDGMRRYLDPRFHVLTTVGQRRTVALGAVLVLLCLLANSAGLALIVLSAVIPILIVITITQHDVFEKESNLLVAAVAAVGAVAGVILSAIGSWILGSQWFDSGVLNYGAGGFGGRFADAAGSAPVIVWLMVGLVIPVIALAAIAGGPIALRRWPQFRNEVMDGMILAGASAAGYSIGASIVYWWPMVGNAGPQTDVSDWTLSILGMSFLRPAIMTLCGAMLGAGVWRYMLKPSTSVILLPGLGGVGGFLLLMFGSIQFQSTGNWAEFAWTLLIAVAVFVLYRKVLDQAVETDRLALGDEATRLVCPSCHRVTPMGAFCAHCGKPLPQEPPVEPDATSPESGTGSGPQASDPTEATDDEPAAT